MVNHLDKIKDISRGQYNPKIIIRTIVGSREPYPGPQHCQDYTEAFKLMLKNVVVIKLDSAESIVPQYKKALERDISSLPGVGPKTLEALKNAGLNTAEDILNAGVESLSAISGIGAKKAEKLLEAARQLAEGH